MEVGLILCSQESSNLICLPFDAIIGQEKGVLGNHFRVTWGAVVKENGSGTATVQPVLCRKATVMK